MPRRVAALHRQGGQWRLVVLERAPTGGAGSVNVVESLSMPVGDVQGALACVERTRPERLIRVLPASSFVSRALEIPDAPEPDLASSLELLAEAQLPAGIAPHRRGWGVIPGPASDGNRSAVLLGWSGPAEEPIAPEIETFTSELVALAGLVEARRSTLAAYADRDSGSIALLAWNGTRSSVRALRESGETDEEWAGAVSNLIEESARRFGIDTDPPAPGAVAVPCALWLDEATRGRAGRSLGGGRASDAVWLREFGIAAGAAATALSAGPATAPLLRLTPSPAVQRRSPVERAVSWLARPRHARVVIAVSALALLLLPLGAAAARRAIYQSKARTIESQQQGATPEELDQRLALYRELDKRRLPMSKLLGDLAGCMPPGITLDSVQVISNDKRLTLRGKAKDSGAITAFTAKLNASGVFAECDAGRKDEKDDGVEFDLQGRVAAPHAEARGIEDWATTPLAVKLYGEEARTAAPAEAEKPQEKKAAPTRSGRRDIFETRSAVKAAEPAPPPLTEAQIRALDQDKARTEFGARQKARSRADLDAATKDRLKVEIEQLRSRLQELRNTSSGGGGGGS